MPVTVTSGTDQRDLLRLADYLAIGSDDDYFLTPLSPYTAQAIADLLGCSLPTTKVVDDIYASATVKLTPAPIPPSPAMTTVPVFLQHNATVLAQRKQKPSDGLVAGHKKDVVIANKVFARPEKSPSTAGTRTTASRSSPCTPGIQRLGGLQPRDPPCPAAHDGQRRSQDDRRGAGRSPTRPLLSPDGVMHVPLSSQAALKAPAAVLAFKPAAGEAIDVLRIDPGVRVVINRPAAASSKPVLLVYYASRTATRPNRRSARRSSPATIGTSTSNTSAQTRFLRETIKDRTVVVAYLENELKSWPAWRRRNGDAEISRIFEAVLERFQGARPQLVLAGHSGGGSLIFGYLNSVSHIPNQVERIAFLDANYAYETERHSDKLAAWLRASDRHYLVVLAYNDAVALANGKSFVSATGGTWGRSHQLEHDLEGAFAVAKDHTAEMQRFTALGGRIQFFLKENPERKVLHTVLVERNGFIESILSGTKLAGAGYVYFGDRAYSRYIRAD